MIQFRSFLDHMRQTGSTTALIKITKETGGYLIVGDQRIKNIILKDYPCLTYQIFSLHEVAQGCCSGLTPKPIFIDTEVIWKFLSIINELRSEADKFIGMLQESCTKFSSISKRIS